MTQTTDEQYISEIIAIEAYKNRKAVDKNLTFMEFLELKHWKIRTK